MTQANGVEANLKLVKQNFGISFTGAEKCKTPAEVLGMNNPASLDKTSFEVRRNQLTAELIDPSNENGTSFILLHPQSPEGFRVAQNLSVKDFVYLRSESNPLAYFNPSTAEEKKRSFYNYMATAVVIEKSSPHVPLQQQKIVLLAATKNVSQEDLKENPNARQGKWREYEIPGYGNRAYLTD